MGVALPWNRQSVSRVNPTFLTHGCVRHYFLRSIQTTSTNSSLLSHELHFDLEWRSDIEKWAPLPQRVAIRITIESTTTTTTWGTVTESKLLSAAFRADAWWITRWIYFLTCLGYCHGIISRKGTRAVCGVAHGDMHSTVNLNKVIYPQCNVCRNGCVATFPRDMREQTSANPSARDSHKFEFCHICISN